MPRDINGKEYTDADLPRGTTWQPTPWPMNREEAATFPFVPYEPGQSWEMRWAQDYAHLFAAGTEAMNPKQARLLSIAFLELYQVVYPRSAVVGPAYPPAPLFMQGLAPVLGTRNG